MAASTASALLRKSSISESLIPSRFYIASTYLVRYVSYGGDKEQGWPTSTLSIESMSIVNSVNKVFLAADKGFLD